MVKVSLSKKNKILSIDFLIFSTFKIRCISQILFDTKEKHSQTSKCKYILQEITIKHRSQYWYIRDLRHWISTLRVSHTKRNVNIEGISLSWENCYWKTYDQIHESHKILMIHLTPPPQKKETKKKILPYFSCANQLQTCDPTV